MKRWWIRLVVAVVVGSTASAAASVDISNDVELQGGSNSAWMVRDQQENLCRTTSKGFAVRDGSFTRDATQFGDAFDSGHMVRFGTQTFNDADDRGDRTPASITAGPQPLRGLTVSVKHTALQEEPVLRTLVRLKNPDNFTKTRMVSLDSNSGGDAAEDTFATDAGRVELDREDRWVVWTPGSADPADATKVTSLTGPYLKRVGVRSVEQRPGDVDGNRDCLSVTMNVSVPPKSTRYLLYFTRLTHDGAAGIAAASDFDEESPYLFDGMSQAQQRQSVNWSLFGTVPAGIDWEEEAKATTPIPGCANKPPRRCILIRGSGPHIHVVGDSHARMYTPVFKKIARRRGFTLSAAAELSCAWQKGLLSLGQRSGDSCHQFQKDQYERVIPRLRPDLIVVAGRTRDDPHANPNGGVGWRGGMKAYREKTARSVRHLLKSSRRVVIMEHLPFSPFEELGCLAAAEKVAECTFRATPSPMRSDRITRREDAKRKSVFSIDIDRVGCPYLPLCVPVLNGELAWRRNHLHDDYVLRKVNAIHELLTKRRVFRRLGG